MTEIATTPPMRNDFRTKRQSKLWNAHGELTEKQMALQKELTQEESPAKRAELNRVRDELTKIINQLDATYR